MIRGPRVTMAVALASALAGFALLAPGGSAAPPKPRLFSSVNVLFSSPMHPHDAARMASGGIRTARLAFDWWGAEGIPGIYNWRKLDRWIGNLASQGVTAIPVLFGAPVWAVVDSIPPGGEAPRSRPEAIPAVVPSGNATAYPPVESPAEIAAWTTFVEAAVSRYGPHGAYWNGPYQQAHPRATPEPVQTWQIWNEPNLSGAFWPRPNVQQYGKLVRITSDAARSVDPGARMALAGLPGRVGFHGVSYVKLLYQEVPHIKRYFDIAAFHPYATGVKGVMNQLVRVRRTMRRAGDGHTPLWVSEIGWGSAKRNPSEYNYGRLGQAKMLSELFAALSRERRRLHLGLVTWFDWRDSKTNVNAPCPWCDRAGLIDKHNHRKPSWDAYRRFVDGAG